MAGDAEVLCTVNAHHGASLKDITSLLNDTQCMCSESSIRRNPRFTEDTVL